MLWSKWKGSLIVFAAWAGLVWGAQPPAPPCDSCSTEIYLTVQEPGKPAQKCCVLFCWHLDTGEKACQVRAVDTDEIITLVNPPPLTGTPELMNGNAHDQNVTRIFRWGNSKTCPPGFPVPPPTVAVNWPPEGAEPAPAEPVSRLPQAAKSVRPAKVVMTPEPPVLKVQPPKNVRKGLSARLFGPRKRLFPSQPLTSPTVSETATETTMTAPTPEETQPVPTTPMSISEEPEAVPPAAEDPPEIVSENQPVTAPIEIVPPHITGKKSRDITEMNRRIQSGPQQITQMTSQDTTDVNGSIQIVPPHVTQKKSQEITEVDSPEEVAPPTPTASVPTPDKRPNAMKIVELPPQTEPAPIVVTPSDTAQTRATPPAPVHTAEKTQNAAPSLEPAPLPITSPEPVHMVEKTPNAAPPVESKPQPIAPPEPVQMVKKMPKTVPPVESKPQPVAPPEPVQMVKKMTKTVPPMESKPQPVAPSEPVQMVKKMPKTVPPVESKPQPIAPPEPVHMVEKMPKTAPPVQSKLQPIAHPEPVHMVEKTPKTAPPLESTPLPIAPPKPVQVPEKKPNAAPALEPGPIMADPPPPVVAKGHAPSTLDVLPPPPPPVQIAHEVPKKASRLTTLLKTDKGAASPNQVTPPPQPPSKSMSAELPVSKTVDAEEQDPLMNPEFITPPAVKKKIEEDSKIPVRLTSTKKSNSNESKVVEDTEVMPPPIPTPGHPGNVISETASVPPPQVASKSGIPLGSHSVAAAWNGVPGNTRYLPVPIVTTPMPNYPPMPPPPQYPVPPQPVLYKNAFTPNVDTKHNVPPQYANHAPTMRGYPTSIAHPGRWPIGYTMPYPRTPYPPYAGSAGAAYSQYQMPPSMAQHYARQPGRGLNPAGQQTPYNPARTARHYQGPLPPDPFGTQQINQVAFQQPGRRSQQYPYNYANPAMDRRGVPVQAPNATVSADDAIYQLLTTLKTSLYPAQREWAAIHLARYEWRSNPHLVQGLLVAAKEDPAATVRVACIKSLVRLSVSRAVMAPTLESIRSDVDPRVRQAIDEALGTGQSTSGDVMPASAINQN